MTGAEQKLFDEMIMHSIKATTEKSKSRRDFHREMYEVTKRVLWDFQEENKKK